MVSKANNFAVLDSVWNANLNLIEALLLFNFPKSQIDNLKIEIVKQILLSGTHLNLSILV